MHSRPVAERLLSLAIGTPRASALYGDLEELSPTRGRLWFWLAYTRALIALCWRTPVAFAVSIITMPHLFGAIISWLTNHTTHHLSDPGLFGQENLRISIIFWNISLTTSRCTCLALLFIAVRFGIRNRLTQLACILFLIATPVYLFIPWLRDLCSILTLLVILTALALPLWRPSLAILAAMILTTAFLHAASIPFLVGIYGKNYFVIPASARIACDNIAFALAAIVCLYLSRAMLRKPQVIA